IVVYNPGYRNSHSGPDFSNARIRIGQIEWIGNVEIHIHSSGWRDHHHETDPAYDNVILHVVWKEDLTVCRKDASILPTVELKGKVSESLLLRYHKLIHNPDTIPCANSIAHVPRITCVSMLEKAMLTRLETKAGSIHNMLANNNNDWEETCYQLLCRNFGFKVNSEAFFQLSKCLPYKMLMKHADKPLQVEALLFGQAGLLDENIDDGYLRLLQREYAVLGRKFGLMDSKMTKVQWRFLRLRPANFPGIRIAQLAALLSQQRNIFSRFLQVQTYRDLCDMLSVSQSEYWKHHYVFGRLVDEDIPSIGQSSVDNIAINTVVPLIVSYGKAKDEQELVDRAVDILQNIRAEQNTITGQWSRLGLQCNTAFDSQAILELYNNYCLRRRCLDCSIGTSLVRPVVA
ncbi:MAG TPA: DUF2851 family protein, partial [Chryseosolibacter sp.]|nr:DUF2851 family protein [Chryseosolibacter sp.]